MHAMPIPHLFPDLETHVNVRICHSSGVPRHSLIVPSLLADAIVLPSGEIRTIWTQ
jgi:hypothetical protein